MELNIFHLVLILMFLLAVSDLIVGVANDAVNFTNSAVGSKVSSRRFILVIASLGILLGAVSSTGMMEVARKGIFRPELYSLEHLVYIFLAVMITDVLLLDFYNTFGLPTSTTVSLVFELFGASLVLAFLTKPEGIDAFSYINSQSAIKIISGIFLSILVAFFAGIIIQGICRICFSFHLKDSIKYLGGLFASLSTSVLLFFILVSALKGSTLIDKDLLNYLHANLLILFGISFVFFFFIFQFLAFQGVNVLKFVILFGTFALAMAFAGNDLVNFVGVPLASYSTILLIQASGDAALPGIGLAGEVQIPSYFLIIAAVIMILTLIFSKKAHSVTKTEVSLASEKSEYELFSSNIVARRLVEVFLDIWAIVKSYSPSGIGRFLKSRYQRVSHPTQSRESFDYLRASVNITTSSLLIMTGTLYKLPLSTTFVTFMVAMGTSLADRAWIRQNAVSRVSGVLTVVAGWFLTAMITTLVSGTLVSLLYFFGFYALILLVPFGLLLIQVFNKIHTQRESHITANEFPFDNITADPEKLIEFLFSHLAESLTSAGEILEKILYSLSTGKKKHQRGTHRQLENLSNLYGSYMSRITEIEIPQLPEVSLLNAYNLESSLHNFRKLVNNIVTIQKSVLYKIDYHFSALTQEEENDLKELKTSIQELFKNLEQLVKKQKSKVSKSKAFQKNLAGLRYKIHKNQMNRVKEGTAHLANLVPYLTIVEEMMDLNGNLIELHNNIERVILVGIGGSVASKKKSKKKKS
jgi:phosphate/sulfate permease